MEIYVPYVDTALGRGAMQYAADLAAQLGVTLNVLYHHNRIASTVLQSLIMEDAELIQKRRILHQMEALLSAITSTDHLKMVETVMIQTAADLDQFVFPESSLLISWDHALRRQDVSVIYPFRETMVSQSKNPDQPIKIFIPFGDRVTCEANVKHGIQLTKQLNGTAVLYHATWTNEYINSVLPRDHMNERARAILKIGESLGMQYLGPDRYVSRIETSETVAHVTDGISIAALIESANLIVTTNDPRVIRGDYQDELLENRITPVMICAATMEVLL